MDLSLQLLRDILPFGPTGEEQKRAVRVRDLLDAASGKPASERIATLLNDVLPSVAAQSNLHMRFKLLEDIRAELDHAFPELENQIAQSVLPLPRPVAAQAMTADNLLKGMAQAHQRIALEIRQSAKHSALQHLFHRSTQRAMALLARRQMLAYRAYAAPSPSSWRMLHELYRLARGPLCTPLNGDTAPIEHEYLGALLFAYLDPGNLSRTDLDSIHASARQLAAYAAVSDATKALPPENKSLPPGFFVSPDDGAPGRTAFLPGDPPPAVGDLHIDCTQILQAIDRNLARTAGRSAEPELDASPVLLQAMRVAVGGKRARRHSRTHFRPRGDLVIGLPHVISFLDGNAYSRRSVDHASTDAGREFLTSEWALMDESPDGFRLRYLKGEKNPLASGAVVALQPRESSKIHVGMIRRIASSSRRLEIGLQLVSPQVSVVDAIDENDVETRAIFLHTLPAYGRFSGLIAPPGTCREGERISIRLPGRHLVRRIGNCIEANEGLEFVALEQLPD